MVGNLQSTKKGGERGASLVEFAVVVPLFLLLVFGTIEAGWYFAEQVEIRNATREGARLAVVDYGSTNAVVSETCSRAELSGSGAVVTIALSGSDTYGLGADSVTVTMSLNRTSLTGIFGFFDQTISSTATMRTERPLVLLSSGSAVCP